MRLLTINNEYECCTKHNGLFKITWFEYVKSTYECVEHCEIIHEEQLLHQLESNEVLLLNGGVTELEVIEWESPSGEKERLNMVVSKVRHLLEKQYGVQTDLAGHCIEASELIVANLKYWGLTDCTSVEGWCEYDDEYYGSDVPYYMHTWVEYKNSLYIDVTADQFNEGMSEENEFSGIIVQEGLPHGMTKTEPAVYG